MDERIFRSYDIRGKYPSQINETIAYKIGLGYGSILQEKYHQTACVLSYDNRLSSPSLHAFLLKGLLETGINVIDYGLTTTPMNYFARHINNLYGIMITASHNPSDENGFKFSFDHYANARGEMIQNFKEYIKRGQFKKGNGMLISNDISSSYIDYLAKNTQLGSRKVKAVFDPANGAVTSIIKKALEKFNIEAIYINDKTDGSFPNHHPDPSVLSNLEQLKNAVIQNNADVGFSFDGDGDRIGIIDNLGNHISIEHYAILITRDIIDKVQNKMFLYDAKCSDVYKDEVKRLKGVPVICRTGSSYTQMEVIKENIPFGIQYVGHISINDRYFSTESAIYSALRLIELLSKTNLSLYELTKDLPVYYNIEEMRINSTDELKLKVINNIKDYALNHNYEIKEIDGLRITFKDAWVYVRASNTGPTINLRAEAKNEKDLNNLVQIFTTLIEMFNK